MKRARRRITIISESLGGKPILTHYYDVEETDLQIKTIVDTLRKLANEADDTAMPGVSTTGLAVGEAYDNAAHLLESLLVE